MLKRVLRKKFKPDPCKSTLENLAGELIDTLGEKASFEWDERFETVLLQIDNRQKEKVITVLESYFSDYWNVLCAEELPAQIQRLMMHFDGLGPEQLLFSTDASDDGEFLYCAWWPWKDGKTTSVRIAPYFAGQTPDQKREFIGRVKQWFAIN